MATKKEIRLTFNNKEQDLIDYLENKSSKVAFIKDLVRREMQRDFNYINCGYVTAPTIQQVVTSQSIQNDNDFEFTLDDLGF